MDELFIAQQTEEHDTDLEALATLYDSNNDGVLNKEDENFKNILIFQDKNQNGIADEGEVITLAEAGIEEISVVSDGQQQILSDGSIVHGKTTYTKSDGTEGIIGDVELAYAEVLPETTITNADYSSETKQLLLTGALFHDILVGDASAADTDLRSTLDWDKLSYNVDGALSILITEDDILSAQIIDDNQLVIELTQEKASEIRINTGDDDSNDEIEVASGFIRNLAGNAAQTDSYTSDVGATYSRSLSDLEQLLSINQNSLETIGFILVLA